MQRVRERRLLLRSEKHNNDARTQCAIHCASDEKLTWPLRSRVCQPFIRFSFHLISYLFTFTFKDTDYFSTEGISTSITYSSEYCINIFIACACQQPCLARCCGSCDHFATVNVHVSYLFCSLPQIRWIRDIKLYE